MDGQNEFVSLRPFAFGVIDTMPVNLIIGPRESRKAIFGNLKIVTVNEYKRKILRVLTCIKQLQAHLHNNLSNSKSMCLSDL